MSKGEMKTCPRCEGEFECHSSLMYLCQCNLVDVEENIRDRLKDVYEDCLCLACLRDIIAGGHIRISKQVSESML